MIDIMFFLFNISNLLEYVLLLLSVFIIATQLPTLLLCNVRLRIHCSMIKAHAFKCIFKRKNFHILFSNKVISMKKVKFSTKLKGNN